VPHGGDVGAENGAARVIERGRKRASCRLGNDRFEESRHALTVCLSQRNETDAGRNPVRRKRLQVSGERLLERDLMASRCDSNRDRIGEGSAPDFSEMVESFARPGGNITGVSCLSSELATKRVELLKDAVPTLRQIGFLYDARSPGKEKELAETVQIARKLGMTVASAAVTGADGLKDAIASLRGAGAEALVISEDAFTFSNRAQIVALTAEQGMVDISAFREFVLAGGVMSYGANAVDRLRHQACMRGAWPVESRPLTCPSTSRRASSSWSTSGQRVSSASRCRESFCCAPMRSLNDEALPARP